MTNFFSGAIESLPREQLRLVQESRLRKQLRFVGERSPFYRRVFDRVGFELHDAIGADDLRSLPVTTKEDVRAALEADPPFGTVVAVPPEQVARVHFSSGTTGAPTPMYWTARDLDRWSELYARYLWAQGMQGNSRAQVSYSFSWFVGGLGAVAAGQRIGAMVIPAGSADTERQIDTLHRFQSTNLVCTPSFASHIAERAEALGRPVRGSSVVGVHVGGEPGANLAATRARIEEAWGARCYDCYGSLEFQPIAWECSEQSGPHLAEDAVLAEVLDRTTREPVAPGQEGVLVLTHLDREAVPLVRWWTGDVVRLDEAACPCGRTHARLDGGVRGRADDMLVIRGVNVFPTAIEQQVRQVAEAGPEFRIVVPADRRTVTELHILIEPASSEVDADRLRDQVASQVREQLSLRPVVEVLPMGALERATHKATRFIDKDDWRTRWGSN